MASFVAIALATSAAFGTLLAAFFAICYNIKREDRRGTLDGNAPSRACMGARHIAGWHRFRWETGPQRLSIVR
jgi:hypothetical protein